MDKAEYQETKIIRCPLNDCGYLWCRLCSQEVDPSMPEHTCDGSNELDHLMKEKGWKYCPRKHGPSPQHVPTNPLFFSLPDPRREDLWVQPHCCEWHRNYSHRRKADAWSQCGAPGCNS